MGQIVVGLDLSPASYAALAWAAGHARTTRMQLHAVHALLLPSAIFSVVGQTSVPTAGGRAEQAEQAYRGAVNAVWELVQPEVGWQLSFSNADPRTVLVAESTHADLLVIGTREHVGWGRILNGSVSHYCLSHACCPVVAVPRPAVPLISESDFR